MAHFDGHGWYDGRMRFVGVLAMCVGCVGDSSPTNEDGGTDVSAKDVAVESGVCTANQASCKDAQTLQTCKSDGSGFDTHACAAGGASSPSAHCKPRVPTPP